MALVSGKAYDRWRLIRGSASRHLRPLSLSLETLRFLYRVTVNEELARSSISENKVEGSGKVEIKGTARTMSISAFFHQESPGYPYFNTIPNSYHLPQTNWNRQDSNLDMTYQGTTPYPSFDRNLENVSVLPTFHSSQDQEMSSPIKNAPNPSIPSSYVQESGYSSVIIPNTIDDFLATHQVLSSYDYLAKQIHGLNSINIQAILLSGFESDFSIDFVELLCIQVVNQTM